MEAADGSGNSSFHRLLEEYAAALQQYLAGDEASAIRRADQLGKQAAASGHSALTLAAVHHRATAAALVRAAAPQDRSDVIAALARFCSSCPAWSAQPLETTRTLEAFFLRVLEPFARSSEALRESNAVLRRLQELREQEAKRIAHSLHDDIAQELVAVQLALDRADCDDGPSRQRHLDRARRMLEELDARLRQLSHELRPTVLDDLGLIPALELLVEGISRRSGVSIALESECSERAPAEVETALYRIVQEALSNVLRHAGATQVQVRFSREGELLCCSVRDDGRGFDLAALTAGGAHSGLGLLGMRERLEPLGGALEINTQPGGGTEIAARIPSAVRVHAGAGRTAPDDNE